MFPSQPTRRRPRRSRPGAETLETRELLTAGAGDTFALMSAAIDKPGGSTSVTFTVAPPQFTRPSGNMVLGIDVAPAQGSSAAPLITSIDDPHGTIVSQAFHSIYNPHLSHFAVGHGKGTSAVIVPLTTYPHQPDRPVTYTVNIIGTGQTSGDVLVDFYLPGDVAGTGTVTQADVQAIHAAQGARVGSPQYNLNADTNRDGRIGPIDLAIARQNLGVSTSIVPLVTANIDPASLTGYPAQVTTLPNVHITGQTSPGASVSFTDTSQTKPQPVTATADASGNYSVVVPLVPGPNVISVTATDAFGQTISGQLSPVVFTTNPTGTRGSPSTGQSTLSNSSNPSTSG